MVFTHKCNLMLKTLNFLHRAAWPLDFEQHIAYTFSSACPIVISTETDLNTEHIPVNRLTAKNVKIWLKSKKSKIIFLLYDFRNSEFDPKVSNL
jgi:hypothetical protein